MRRWVAINSACTGPPVAAACSRQPVGRAFAPCNFTGFAAECSFMRTCRSQLLRSRIQLVTSVPTDRWASDSLNNAVFAKTNKQMKNGVLQMNHSEIIRMIAVAILRSFIQKFALRIRIWPRREQKKFINTWIVLGTFYTKIFTKTVLQ